MKANKKLIQKQRRYSEEFKRKLVEEFESGKFSVPQMERIYGIGNPTLYKWIYQYSTVNVKGYRVVEMKDSSSKKVADLEARVKELEGIIGKKQIKIDYLETMIDVAKEELDIDIKKNYSTPQSDASGKEKKN
ncbi:MAG: transposase [Fluviicola sp.]